MSSSQPPSTGLVTRPSEVVPPMGALSPVQHGLRLAEHPMGSVEGGGMAGETTRVIRPAAVLDEASARTVLSVLEAADVARGGVWNASIGLWQRYDKAWDGPG